MISFDTLGLIEIDNQVITLGNKIKNRRINKFIIHNDYIYLCTNLSEHLISLFPEYDIKADNILKLDKKGNLIYKTGLLKLEYPPKSGNIKEFEASNLSIQDNQLYLGYGIGYEAWADIETGKIIKGRFDGRK
tara:strand:- start:34 stop:432 length:399 start_codon:yes stop_codon:yes gene_type:complete